MRSCKVRFGTESFLHLKAAYSGRHAHGLHGDELVDAEIAEAFLLHLCGVLGCDAHGFFGDNFKRKSFGATPVFLSDATYSGVTPMDLREMSSCTLGLPRPVVPMAFAYSEDVTPEGSQRDEGVEIIVQVEWIAGVAHAVPR